MTRVQNIKILKNKKVKHIVLNEFLKFSIASIEGDSQGMRSNPKLKTIYIKLNEALAILHSM